MDFDELFVDVDGTNQAPTVDAGPDAALELPQDTLTLNGSVTDDGFPTNGTLSSTWSQLSGPGVVVFGDIG